MQTTLIDRAISALSPKWAFERAQYRAANTAMNSYRGGIGTRLSETWGTSSGFQYGTAGEREQLASARDRAYRAYRSNPVARTLLQTETDNVIGDGLNFQPTSSSEEWNREAIDRYYAWLDVCSVRGPDVHSGCEIQRLLWERSRCAGDIGWVLVSRGNESRIQVVPAENISTPDSKHTDKSIKDGIKFDAFGAPVEFYVLYQDELSAKRNWQTVFARDFVHLAHRFEPTQARGETCYMTIFDDLNQLAQYKEGVALAAWMATVMGIVFKKTNAASALNALSTLTNSQGDPQKAVTFENGMVAYVGTEDEVAQVQAHQPMTQTPEFIRTLMRGIGQPFDMPLEILAKDMSQVNFASARIGLLNFYRACRIKADRFATRWSRTIGWWLSRERLRGANDPNRWTSAFPEDYRSHRLLVNEWPYTDPVSEAQGDLLEVSMGSKSMQQVISERGRDVAQILADRQQWQEDTRDLPQVLSNFTRDPAPEKPEEPEKPEPAEPTEPVAENYARTVVSAWMRDKDKRDAVWNVSDVPETLTAAGVKLDPTVDSADGEGIPRLPDVEGE